MNQADVLGHISALAKLPPAGSASVGPRGRGISRAHAVIPSAHAYHSVKAIPRFATKLLREHSNET
eukprot:1149309-Pelagomonas_calceolata.AAC.4